MPLILFAIEMELQNNPIPAFIWGREGGGVAVRGCLGKQAKIITRLGKLYFFPLSNHVLRVQWIIKIIDWEGSAFRVEG